MTEKTLDPNNLHDIRVMLTESNEERARLAEQIHRLSNEIMTLERDKTQLQRENNALRERIETLENDRPMS